MEMPRGSSVIAFHDHERVRTLMEKYQSLRGDPVNIIWYGENEGADYQIISREVESRLDQVKQTVKIKTKLGVEEFNFGLSGSHNAQNVLASIIACSLVGLTHDQIQNGLSAFHPIKRRQQLISNKNGILIIEDFAHHPKEVTVTLEGLIEAYRPKRLIAVFEPRSNTSRKEFFKDEYVQALSNADIVILRDLDQNTAVYSGVSPEARLLSVNQLANDLNGKDTETYCIKEVADIFKKVTEVADKGDLVAVMSNGDFGGLPAMFLDSSK